ncbi:hypothetical protein A2771_01105 [Candidatus Woesebacteria bacterium RIFCSPHIGHO2_01_FULL_38_26b]|uniref:Glycosyl transferase family 1 domain-containing protein n=1 Tax=Candidatus Woesebacteria bacterium RIFCSPHIGHO2_01_FULL_38_26b TaxID=1802491 RepID=A0A1F7Y4I1_9BACT|nr:MAG: hypothetical protein A2771_01105 [Candidatus Woesebacteria bacterium RIFCSPHIGHO2_01_FULL_38_26b]
MTLINAYKYYDDSNHRSNIKIEFCGDGELANECKKYGKVHGFVDPSPFYQKAKYCFASGYLTILEALANKCLVFTAYDNPLQKDYYQLVPFKKYINISSNPVKLSQTLIGLSKNEKRANTLIKNGYNWVKTQTWEKLHKIISNFGRARKSNFRYLYLHFYFCIYLFFLSCRYNDSRVD